MTKISINIILLSIFLLFSLNIKSQNFGGGCFAGIVASQISGDDLSGFNKPGFNGGIFTNLKINEKLKLQLELSYIQKGSRDNAYPDKGDYESYLLRLNYVEMYLNFKFKLNKFFAFDAGPCIAYLFSHSEKYQYGELPLSVPFKKTDTGLTGGLHYIINNKLDAVFRISNSILPVREHKGGGTYRLNRGQYNTVVSLSLHYNFKIKNKQNL